MGVPFTSDLIDGRYRVGDVIGFGGVAEVRSGEDLRLRRPVAIKLLKADMAARASFRDRFESEARAAARIADLNVVAVYDSGEHEGVPYIVMELLSGRTLGDEIAQGPLAESRARAVFGQVLDALQAAHDCGVLHRDIKPDNILIAANGDARVADFGIAKVTDEDSGTIAGAVLGTPSYLSPERVLGAPASVASDVYAAGVVLYEALAGIKPFVADTPSDVVHAIAYGEPAPLRVLRPNVDPRLEAVVERAMSRESADRFRDAASMRVALDVDGAPSGDPATATTELPATGLPSRGGETTVVDARAPASRHRLGAPPSRRASPSAPIGLAMLVIALFLLGAALIVFARRPSGSPAGVAPTSTATTPVSAVTPALSGAIDDLDAAVAR
ncbi:MAG: serine/threonine-protein kinase [Acidimicrobiales bacterium]